MNKTPSVSVVMSVFNGEKFLNTAVASILNQTFTDFEFIIINDGSTDKTADMLKEVPDKRVKILHQENQGLVASLNCGIQNAAAPLIARMDADDISMPTRLEKQLNYFDYHPDTAVLGTSIYLIDEGGRRIGTHSLYTDPIDVKTELLIRGPFAHGSVIMQRELVVKSGGYKKEYWPAEDYDLWRRLARYQRVANLAENLYCYRINSASISAINSGLQDDIYKKINAEIWTQDINLLNELPPLKNKLQRYTSPQLKDRIIMDQFFLIKHAAFKRPSRTIGLIKDLIFFPSSLVVFIRSSFSGLKRSMKSSIKLGKV